MTQNATVVPITMLNETFHETQEIQSKFHAASFSDAIRMAVDLANQIIKYSEEGKK